MRKEIETVRHRKYSTQQTKLANGHFLRLLGDKNVQAETQTSVHLWEKWKQQLSHLMTCGRPSVSQSAAVMGNESQAKKHNPQANALIRPEHVNPQASSRKPKCMGYSSYLSPTRCTDGPRRRGRNLSDMFQVHGLITGFSKTTVHTACSSAPRPPRCHPLGPNGLGSQLHATQTFPRPAFGSQPRCLVSAVWPCPSQPIFMDLNLCQLFLASGEFFRWDLWPS